MENDLKFMQNRVLFYTGRAKILFCSKCICGGTPIGILLSLFILNFPFAMLICFNVIKTTQVTDGGARFDLLQLESFTAGVLLHLNLLLVVLCLIVSNFFILKAAFSDPGIIPSRFWNLKEAMPERYTEVN